MFRWAHQGTTVTWSAGADQVTVVGAGGTLDACLAAAGRLGADGISARVTDL